MRLAMRLVQVTFPLMQLELCSKTRPLSHNLSPSGVAWVTILAFGTVLFDGVARLATGPLRDARSRDTTTMTLRAVGYILSFACFVPLLSLYWNEGAVDLLGSPEWTSQARSFATAWIAYPIFSILFDMLHVCASLDSQPTVSFAKDIAYSIADVGSKAVLTFYATLA